MKLKTPLVFQYILSIALVVIVSGIGYFIQHIFGYRSVALLLLLLVSVLAMLFEIWPVLLSALLSALIWDFFFIPPRFTITVNSAEDLLLLLMYFVIAMLNAVLTSKLRQMEKISHQKVERENTIKLYNTLLNSLSHELRTPIATIIGASDTLKDNGDKLNDANRTELVNEISKASLRLDKQVANLLNMSRLESGFISPKGDWTDVQELMHSVVNKLEKDSILNKFYITHKIKIVVQPGVSLVKIDAGLLEHVVFNILSNALVYTPANTQINITAEIDDSVKTEKSTGLETLKHDLIINIEDNGPGFPYDEIDKVFNKFYRLKNSKTGGTGLGLSISKGFTESMKGSISLKNADNGGAQFIIRIPVEVSNVKEKNEFV